MSVEEIHLICGKYNIQNYSINPDGSIDVKENVNLIKKNLKEIPLKFNRVYGFFDISDNKLTSLEGSPISDGDYYFNNNPLESLDGFNGNYNRLSCHNRDKLIKKHKRKQKLKQLYEL